MDANPKWKKAVLIAGLPGSGKTTLANELLSAYLGSINGSEQITACIIDNPSPENSHFLGKIYSHNVTIICDPHFCKRKTRLNAVIKLSEMGVTTFDWMFFENSPEKCKNNVKLRSLRDNDHRNVYNTIDWLTKIYDIPFGVTPMRIWQE